jgi:signal transduction histidine kinase
LMEVAVTNARLTLEHHLADRREFRPQAEVEVLRALSHGFGSAEDRPSALSGTIRWVGEALAMSVRGVHIFLASRDGVLRGAASSGLSHGPPARRAKARRRAFETKTAVREDIDDRPGWALAVLPLVSRGHGMGVVEVTAPARTLDERWDTLVAVVSEAAIVLRNVELRGKLQREATAEAERAAFMTDLIRADSRESVARCIVRFASRRFRAPAAAWLRRGDGQLHVLVATRGLRGDRLVGLRSLMESFPPWETLPVEERDRLRSQFASAAGVTAASSLIVGDLVVLIGEQSDQVDAFIAAKAPLLADVLDRLATVAWAERRNEQLDRSLALTAHELRAPVLVAQAAIDQYLRSASPAGSADGNGSGSELLRRSSQELGELSGDVQALLEWGVGHQVPQRRSVDIVKIVREAVVRGTLPADRYRVRLAAPPKLLVRGDRRGLRLAVANLVRNAVAYSPPGTPVDVVVEDGGEVAYVQVQDQGPGVPEEERPWIFDPFARGRAGAARSGNGLGLFLARRLVEGHEGRIWVDSNERGAKFTIELPRAAKWQTKPAPAS